MKNSTAQKGYIRKEVDMRNKLAQKGFTLIELLIVIVIIGVLAGIVIVILNPAVQRARAQDSVILSTINKISAEVQAYANSDITGVGNFPTCLQLAGDTLSSCSGATLQNVASCACGGAGAVSFTINGVSTAPYAAAGSAVTPGQFRYTRNGNTSFCIAARALNPTTGNSFLRLNTANESAPLYTASGCT